MVRIKARCSKHNYTQFPGAEQDEAVDFVALLGANLSFSPADGS